MGYKSFQEVTARYALGLGLDEQAPLAEWEAGLKAALSAKKKALSAIKNPSLKHKTERECADLEEAARLAAQLNLFGRLRRFIQEDKQETFEWELRKPDNQAALPKEDESAFGDFLDLKGEVRKKWPGYSFPVAKPAVVEPTPPAPAPVVPPPAAPIAVPAPPPPVAPAVPPAPAPVPPAAPPPAASVPQAQTATRPAPVPGVAGSGDKGAKVARISEQTLRQTVPERPAVPPVAVRPSVQPTQFGPPPSVSAAVADKAAPGAASDKTAPTTDKVLKKGEKTHPILRLIWQFFTLFNALAASKVLLYALGVLLLVIAGLIAKHEFSRSSQLHTTTNIHTTTNRLVLPPVVTQQVVIQYARLSVGSQPGGVTVTLNGESKATPAEFTLKPGSYQVGAALEGYWPTNADITLKGDQQFALSFVDPELPGAALPSSEAGGNSAVVPLAIKYARLAVISLSGNATASVKGQSKATPANFRLRPDQYDVQIALNGFFETNIPVRLKPDQDLTLTLQDASKPGADARSSDPNSVRVPLKSIPPVINNARLVVKTVPSAARVTLNAGNERREQAAPATFEPLRPGSYEIEASAPGYYAKTETVRLAPGEARTLTWELQELRAKIAVKTEPTGARVYLDGVLQFEHTPATRLLAKLGDHEVGVELDGYRRQSRQIRASSADPVLVDFGRLAPQSATLTIRSTPSYATITLGGQGRNILGTTPQSFEVKPPGQCTVEVALAGYEPVTRTVVLADGDRKEIDIPLKARKIILSVRTNPTGASIYVDGAKSGSTDEHLQLAPGSYDIQLRKEGYQTVSRRVNLRPGAQPAPISETLALIQAPPPAIVQTPPPAIVQTPPPRPVSNPRNEPPLSEYASSERLIQVCRDEAAKIEREGSKGNLFTPATAKEEKRKWEVWKSDHQSQWSPELQRAYTSIIRAINMHTQGAM